MARGPEKDAARRQLKAEQRARQAELQLQQNLKQSMMLEQDVTNVPATEPSDVPMERRRLAPVCPSRSPL